MPLNRDNIKDIDKLRIGIMCNGFIMEKWKADAIKSLIAEPHIQIVLLIVDARKNKKKTILNKIGTYPYRQLLWRIYKRYFVKPEATKLVSAEDLLNKIPSLNCTVTKKGKFSEYFSEYEINEIKKHKPDIIVRFGFNILRGEILTAAKYGVWSYHHGDENVFRGGPPCFWEIYHNHNTTGVILQQLNNELDAGIILKKGYYKTIKKSYSYNLNQALSESSHWIKQLCVDIINQVPLSTFKAETNAPVKTFPRNHEMILFIAKKIKHTIQFHYRELFTAEKWNIGLAKGTPENLLTGTIENEKWLPPLKRGEYRADPFGYFHNEHLCIIHEKYSYNEHKGWIEIQRSNEESNIAIESGKHLSYPYIFSFNNDLYCVPESYQKNSIELYRLSKNNNKWEFENTIADGVPAVDSSLVYYNKRWWLFCTREDNNPNNHLYIYHSDSLTKKFIPHNNNPVKTDIRSARPAGTFFTVNNELYRPSQDCSKSYGCGISINKIEKLNENEFSETTINYISPNKKWSFNRGIHTISIAGNFILFDAKTYEFNLPNFINKLKKKMGFKSK